MSDFAFTVDGGTSLRLKTAGKYCDRDIVVTATGGGGGEDDVGALLSNTLTAIESNATSVKDYACRGSTALLSVNLPNATKVGQNGFYGCTNMTTFAAPKVTSLGASAFYQCTKLTSINFPNATSVPSNCFNRATALKIADFGAAKSIGTYGFYYCSALKALVLRRTGAICTLSNTTNCLTSSGISAGTGYVYVPNALLNTYKAATNWTTYAAQFRALESYTVDGTITGALDSSKI